MRSLHEALVTMRRTPYQTTAAVLVVWIAFFVGFVFSVLMYGSQKLLTYFETRPQVIAFFKPNVEDAKISSIEQEMKAKPYVRSVVLVSKDEALALYKQDNQKDPLLLDLVTADVLPASIEVSGVSVASLEQVQTDLQQYADSIEEVVYQKDFVSNMVQWTNSLRRTGLIVAGVLAATTFILISGVVSMKLTIKRKEMSVLRLLGATQSYVYGPFLVEGALYGFLGALFGWLSNLILCLYLTPTVLSYFDDVHILPLDLRFVLIQLGIGSLVGIILGLCSSTLALRRLVK